MVAVLIALWIAGTIVGDQTPNAGKVESRATAAPKVPTTRKLTGPLGIDAQSARNSACQERMKRFQTLGVWVHGGARPGVDRSAWELLTSDEKTEMFEVAACVASAGQVAEKIITVSEQGNGPEIETRRVANDRDFAAEAASKP